MRPEHTHIHNIVTHQVQNLIPIMKTANEYPVLMCTLWLPEDAETLSKLWHQKRKMTKYVKTHWLTQDNHPSITEPNIIIKYGIGLLSGEGSPLTSEEHGNPTPLIKNPSSKQQWEISHFEDSDTKVYVSPVYSIYYQVPLCPRLWIWLTQYPLLHPTYLIISWMEKLLSIQMIMKLFTPFILLACIVILFVSMVFTIHLYPHV